MTPGDIRAAAYKLPPDNSGRVEALRLLREADRLEKAAAQVPELRRRAERALSTKKDDSERLHGYINVN